MDEARFGTHSKIGHGWFPTGERSTVKMKLGFKNFYVYSAVEPTSGEGFHLILPRVNAEMLSLFLDRMAKFYEGEEITIVMDGAGWHRAKDLVVPKFIRIVYLPPYSPELNPVERFWLNLKRLTIRNKIYETIEQLEQAVAQALNLMTLEQVAQLCAIN